MVGHKEAAGDIFLGSCHPGECPWRNQLHTGSDCWAEGPTV